MSAVSCCAGAETLTAHTGSVKCIVSQVDRANGGRVERDRGVGAGNSRGTATKKRALGAPDYFVWAPVLSLFLAAGICMTIGQSMSLAVIMVVIAVVMVVLDMWFNR